MRGGFPEGDVVIAESTLRKLEQRLLDSVTGVDDVQFVFASTRSIRGPRGPHRPSP